MAAKLLAMYGPPPVAAKTAGARLQVSRTDQAAAMTPQATSGQPPNRRHSHLSRCLAAVPAGPQSPTSHGFANMVRTTSSGRACVSHAMAALTVPRGAHVLPARRRLSRDGFGPKTHKFIGFRWALFDRHR